MERCTGGMPILFFEITYDSVLTDGEKWSKTSTFNRFIIQSSENLFCEHCAFRTYCPHTESIQYSVIPLVIRARLEIYTLSSALKFKLDDKLWWRLFTAGFIKLYSQLCELS